MRTTLAAIFVAAVIVSSFIALQQTYFLLSNRAPTRIDCHAFLESGSHAKWVELTDCQLDYGKSVHLQDRKSGRDEGTFVPVRPAGEHAPIRLMLRIDSDDLRPRFQRTLAAAIAANDTRGAETVAGLIQSGVGAGFRVRSALRNSTTAGLLAPDFAIIEDAARPRAADAIRPASIAILLIAVGAFARSRRQRRHSDSQALIGKV